MGNRSRPNIVYILADDMGYGDLSCLNEKSKIKTPNFDSIAEKGMKFTDAHSSSAVCTPSRYSILTGRYNWRSSLKQGVLWGYSPPLIEEGRTTVPSLLKDFGYRTACIGKWHLGMEWQTLDGRELPDGVDFSAPIKNGPITRGFDYFYGISASLDMPPYVYIENDRLTALPNRMTACSNYKKFWRKGPTGADFKHKEVLPKLTEKVLEKIDEWADEPFFIYFPMPAPHTPILPSREFRHKTKTNSYGDFVLMCDDAVGKILNKLKQIGIEENTIVIYTSDNGCSPRADFNKLARKGHNPSYIFRGHKADIYEGGHRIPLLIQWPAAIKAKSVADETVCLIDLMATIADILEYGMQDNEGEDSVSNLPLWLGEKPDKPQREATVHHSMNGSFSIRKGKWKLELCPGSGGWSHPIPGKETEGLPPIQLYDLEVDIGERKNVQAEYPGIVDELKALIIKYIKDGRSTKGEPQKNTGADYWEQLHWMTENDRV
ncbi:MAG: arylsulfatase [Clostridia bacterium]|nr:arylsulfatase [Clostridia bacterium]